MKDAPPMATLFISRLLSLHQAITLFRHSSLEAASVTVKMKVKVAVKMCVCARKVGGIASCSTLADDVRKCVEVVVMVMLLVDRRKGKTLPIELLFKLLRR